MATNEASAQPLIFPIGQYVGALYHTVGTQDRDQMIMAGGQVVKVSDDELAIWLLARGVPEEIEKGPWTRTALVETATQAGIATPAEVVERLSAQGLLAETYPGSQHSIEFAEAYRLIPTMLGLGNSAKEPWLYSIGFFEQPVLSVAPEIYRMWEWAHIDNSLWAACHAYADISKRAGATEPDETIPEQVLAGFLGATHALLTSSAAYLDLALLDEPVERPA